MTDGAASPTSGERIGRGVRIVVLAPDLGDVSTLKRADTLLRNGFDVKVFTFRRRDWYNGDVRPTFDFTVLGETGNARYVDRLFTLARALPVLFKHRGQIARADLIYARNLDQLLLARIIKRLFAPKAAVIYEMIDVPPIMSRNTLPAKALRAIEKRLMADVRLLVTSSPGYVVNYFDKVMRYRGPHAFVENKIGVENLPTVRGAADARADDTERTRPWTVGYFGTIKGETTFQVLIETAKASPQVEFIFRGIVTSVDPVRFADAVASLPNVRYLGPYRNPEDLAEIYGEIDLNWAIDLTDEQANSIWCMPCRYYEGGAFGVPILVAAGQQVATEVAKREIGWAFEKPYVANLVRFFQRLTRDEHDAVRARLRSTPVSAFVDTDDGVELARELARLAGR